MKDTTLYEQLLGLKSPWSVKKVDLFLADQRVVVEVVLKKGQVWADPTDATKRAHVNGWTERQWRHLDTCQFETVIKGRVPQLKYSDGTVEELAVPWAERYSRVTTLMAAFVIKLLQACPTTQAVCSLTRLSWSTVNAIMVSAVERGMLRRTEEEIAYLGIDEKSSERGHTYASVLTDIDRSRVLDLVPERKLEAAVGLLETLTPTQRLSVKAVAMDMWPAYMSATKQCMPQADIVHDKFHVSKYLGEAVDAVRKLIVHDNPRALFTVANRYEPELTRVTTEFAHHYGTVVIPARLRKPPEKAKVEFGVKLVERWIMARLLPTLNNRPFKKLPGCRTEAFAQWDAPYLQALPTTGFVMAEWKRASVNIDHHIEYAGHYCSVPHALVHQVVELRITPATVEVLAKSRRVASHARNARKRRLYHGGGPHAGGASGARRLVTRSVDALGGIGRSRHRRTGQALDQCEAASRARLLRLPGLDALGAYRRASPHGGSLYTRLGHWGTSLSIRGLDSGEGPGSPTRF